MVSGDSGAVDAHKPTSGNARPWLAGYNNIRWTIPNSTQCDILRVEYVSLTDALAHLFDRFRHHVVACGLKPFLMRVEGT